MIAGTNLTHINYGNIDGEVKFIDTIKYYQNILIDWVSTLTEYEKNSEKYLTKNFLINVIISPNLEIFRRCTKK